MMFDNLARIRSNYEKSLTDYRADRTQVLDTLTTASFFGGLGLVLLVAMLGMMRIVSGIHLWVAAIGATTCCLIIGAILTDPGRLATGPDRRAVFLLLRTGDAGSGFSSRNPMLFRRTNGASRLSGCRGIKREVLGPALTPGPLPATARGAIIGQPLQRSIGIR